MAELATAAPPVEAAAPPVETTPTETTEQVVETPESEGAVETTETESVETSSTETQDGRVIPQELRELFKTNPKLKNVFFSERAYRQEFPTVQEAREAKEFIETVGGKDGWESIQQAQNEQADLDGLYYSRNPQKQRDFVNHLVSQDSGAFTSIVPVALEAFHQSNPKEYNRVMSVIVANTFARAFNGMGVRNVLAQVKANPAQAEALLGQLDQWVNAFDEIAKSSPEVDPREEALNKREQEFEERTKSEEHQRFQTSYQQEAGRGAEEATAKHLKTLLGNRQIDKDDMRDLIEDVFRKVSSMAMQDAEYMKQMKALVGRRDQRGATKRFLSKYNQLLPEAAKRITRKFSLGAKPAPAPKTQATSQTTSTSAPAGVMQVGRAPKPTEIDYSRTSNAMITRGEAWLKTGKRVKWE